MSNPLIDKFYELHPEKKEEEKPEEKPELEIKFEIPEEYQTKSKEEIKEQVTKKKYTLNDDYWNKWLDAYRQTTTYKNNGSDTVTISTNHSLKNIDQTHKMNYQFVEMSERIKTKIATVTNVEVHTDHYSNQTKYIFEVIQNGRSYPF